LGPCETAEL